MRISDWSSDVCSSDLTFGPVKVEMDFTGATNFFPPRLESQGNTPMGEAIELALQMLRDRKDRYRANGVNFYRTWVFLITYGTPPDNGSNAANSLKEGAPSKASSAARREGKTFCCMC